MKQKTIRYPVSIQGIGLHTGDTCTVKLSPSTFNSGIRFFLNTTKNKRILYSDAYKVVNPIRSTNLGDEFGTISTIEHLMACLHVMEIDNVDITVVGKEIPILDGSALPWLNLLKAAEVKILDVDKNFIRVEQPYELSNGNSHIYAEPYDGLEIRMKIEFDHPVIGKQEDDIEFWSWDYGNRDDYQKHFERHIAPARTFGIWEQIKKARESGLVKGGSMQNAIVLDDKEILNPPLRLPNEFVAHKLLDFIGDIYVNGPILGFFDVCCSGHQFNNQAIRQIFQELT